MTLQGKSIKIFFLALAGLHINFCTFGTLTLGIDDKRCSNLRLVGGKAASLSLMKHDLDINIPTGFCITTKMYDEYLESIGVNELILNLKHCNGNETQIEKLSKKIKSKILHGKLKEEWLSEIKNQYNKLQANDQNLLVAVRSSSTAEDLPNFSFAGQYDSYLNSKGIDQIVNNIKKVWASTYSSNSINYRNRNGIQHSNVKMGVLIQKMITAASSGRAYSVDIETGAPFICIKNIFGLGEAEASGITSPDTWILCENKKIIKRRLGKKQFRIEYNSQKCENKVIENSEKLQNQFAMSCKQSKDLAGIICLIHKYFLQSGISHIEIEYAITSDGEIFITQARPETSWGKSETTSFKTINKKKIRKNNIVILKGGQMGWGGVSFGPLRVLRSLEDAKNRHQKGDIIVVGNTTNIWENIMVNSEGLISQEDASSSHAVATTREESIPSIVGASGALDILEKYDGQLVTLDATSRRIYLGEVPKEALCFPKKIKTIFQEYDLVSETHHWNNASCLGLTSVDSNAGRWLKRPVGGKRTLQYEISKKGFDWIAKKADLPIIKEKRIHDGTLEISFPKIHQWREILQKRDLEFFEKMYNERIRINDNYIKTSLSLNYTPKSVKEWFDAAIAFYGMQSISYNVCKISDGLLHNALMERKLQEPYLSLVRPNMEALYGRSLSKERVCCYNNLLSALRSDFKLSSAIRKVAENSKDAELFLKDNFLNFYIDIESYAKNYRVTENFSIDFIQPWPLKFIAKQLVKDLDSEKKENLCEKSLPVKEVFFPDDKEFQRIAQLAILSHKLKLDTHHIRFRGHWKFREFIIPFGKFLKNKGVISNSNEIFDHKMQWLLNQLEKYKDCEELKQLEKKTTGFQLLPYKTYTI